MTLAEQAKADHRPYRFCIANFVMRTFDREQQTVTFHFEDSSTLTFNIRYEVVA